MFLFSAGCTFHRSIAQSDTLTNRCPARPITAVDNDQTVQRHLKGASMKLRTSSPAEKRRATETIWVLEQGGFYVQCPDPGCDETVRLRDCGLFYGEDFTEAALVEYKNRVEHQSNRLAALNARLKRIPESSETQGRAVNAGRIWERLAPCMDSFCFDSGDCRSLFDPIDYLVFEGLQSGLVKKILFLEIKTGKSLLKATQKLLRAVVDAKQVSMHVHGFGGQE